MDEAVTDDEVELLEDADVAPLTAEQAAAGEMEIIRWMQRQAAYVRQDNDALVPVTGKRRRGKSTLAMYSAMIWDPDFNLQEQMAWTAKQFTLKARALPKFKPIILDEGIRGLMSMDALTEDNKHLAKFATIAGDRNLIAMLLIPNLKRFAGIFREDYCEWNLHVQRRGQAVLRRLKDDDDRVYERPFEVLPFTFPKLPVRMETDYRKLKHEFQERFDDGKNWDTEASLRHDIRARIEPLVRSGNWGTS